jgi:4-amino-4-deoxy-L-arabinose transferase-like glycosyltransferase
MQRKLPAWLAPAFSVLLFCLAGLALIPYPGLQNDELFFSGPLYFPDASFYRIALGTVKIPIMVMSYSGALKTWIYAVLFGFFVPNEWSVRVPVLLMGMGTIWLTWIWVRRIAGNRAAAITAVLLSADSMFLITNTFDWGPVALQHILLMGGLVAFDRWLRIVNPGWLALAFFLWGLGMWDKALLVWPLGGLALASICIYPRETLQRLRSKPLAIAAVAFLIGAAPLVTFNVALRGQTATANAHFTAEDIRGKVAVLRQTVDGSAMFGYLVYPKDSEHEIRPRNAVGRISAWVASIAGDHKRNAMLPAYVAALIGFVLLTVMAAPVRRLLLFLLVTSIVVWVQMALTKGAGGASHHVVLLLPFPLVFLAITFTSAAERLPRYGLIVLTVCVTFLAGENLLNTNEYLKDLAAYGAAGGWTDALYRLAGAVGKPNQAHWYGLVDWGYLNGLNLMFEGDLPVFIAQVPAAGASPNEAELAEIRREIDGADRLFIQHTDDKQMFPGVNGRLRDVAGQLGYAEKLERVVHDLNGRPVFELFRFERVR